VKETWPDAETEHLLRELAPQVLGAVVRRFRDFAAGEDAVQEAMLAAFTQWPHEGVPENPRGWLIQVASRRMTDQMRSEIARRERETAVARDAETPEPRYFNISSKLYTYTEAIPYYGRASNGRSIDISFLGAGVDFASDSSNSDDVLRAMTATENAFQKSSSQLKKAFQGFRSRTKPNAFSVFTEELWGGTTSLGVPPRMNLPYGAGESDCQGRLADQAY